MLNGGYLAMKGTMFKFVKLKKKIPNHAGTISDMCLSF